MAKKKINLQEQAMKERQANIAAAKKAMEDKKIMVVDPESIINIPFSGGFRRYIEDSLNYIFSLHTEEELLVALHHIKDNFKNVPDDAPPNPLMNTLWTLMTIQTEFNRQAVEQGSIIITDEEYDATLNSMMGLMQETSDSDLSQMFKNNKENFEDLRKQEQQWKTKKSDQNKASAYDSPQSNED